MQAPTGLERINERSFIASGEYRRDSYNLKMDGESTLNGASNIVGGYFEIIKRNEKTIFLVLQGTSVGVLIEANNLNNEVVRLGSGSMRKLFNEHVEAYQPKGTKGSLWRIGKIPESS